VTGSAAQRLPIVDWLPVITLITVGALAAPIVGSLIRPLFIAGCFIVGWHAWSRSPEFHLQVAIALFSFTPFLRRVVDHHLGFDHGATMIAGPLIAILPPCFALRDLVRSDYRDGRIGIPILIFAICVAYCVILTLARGEWSQALSGTLKWGAPPMYALALYLRGNSASRLLGASAAAFIFILPVTGLYGIYQYIDPPLWDRYWLALAPITSAGQPLPYEVRTFSTMHGPASFATFTAFGLLLVYFSRPTWIVRLLMVPAALALLLSLYRTVWLSLSASLIFCLLFTSTRKNAIGATLLLGVVVMIGLVYMPFGDVIAERLSTLASASSDSSGEERMYEYWTLWNQTNGGLIGSGFSPGDTAVAGTLAVDGMIAACWSAMGIVAGMLCLASVIWVIGVGVRAALTAKSVASTILGAIACGWLVQLPLATITSGELGFLFWAFASLSLGHQRRLQTQ
jgi:hypothetical protein